MPPAEEQKDEVPKGDQRVNWIMSKAILSLKLKPTDIAKMNDNDASRKALLAFLDSDKDTDMCLFITLEANQYVATRDIPTAWKKKSVYFSKTSANKIGGKNISKQLLYGDLAANPLIALHDLSQSVFFPSITKRKLQSQSTKEVLKQFHKYLHGLSIACGQLEGTTILPLPLINKEETTQKEYIHGLEDAVIAWMKQIREVLDTDPEDALRNGGTPGPQSEIKFWKSKSTNINNIMQQLEDENIQKLTNVLQECESSYYPAFEKLISEVKDGQDECNSNVTFLEPLIPYLEELDPQGVTEFTQLKGSFKQLMHMIFLVWCHSKYFNKINRLILLIQEVCNDLIRKASIFVDKEQILQDEAPESVKKLRDTLKVCGILKDCFFFYRNKVATETDNPWKVQVTALFQRLDRFLERIKDILELMEFVVLFSGLEKIEIGGTKGYTLTNTVKNIFDEFFASFEALKTAEFDLLDIDDLRFDVKYKEFRSMVFVLERRLGNILTVGLSECPAIAQTIKLVDTFSALLQREIIRNDFEKCTAKINRQYHTDLEAVQSHFQSYQAKPPIFRNMPTTAGALIWCHGLIERIDEPLMALQNVDSSILKSMEGQEALKLHSSIKSALRDFQNEKYKIWADEVEAISEEYLNKTLLKRVPWSENEKSTLLKVNFDPKLVSLLREVNYIEKLNETIETIVTSGKSDIEPLTIPDTAKAVSEQSTVYRVQTQKLDYIGATYNKMMTTINEVEKPLIDAQLQTIDSLMEAGLADLKWTSEGIDDFVENVTKNVNEAANILNTLQNNTKASKDVLEGLKKHRIFDPEEEGRKIKSLQVFTNEYSDLKRRKFKEFKHAGRSLWKKLEASYKSLNEIAKDSTEWTNYVESVNDIVIEGICQAVTVQLQHLSNTIAVKDYASNCAFFQISLDLNTTISDETAAQFVPALTKEDAPERASLESITNEWVEDITYFSHNVKRIATRKGDYQKEVRAYVPRDEVIAEIAVHLKANADECRKFREQFLVFSYLWTNDIQESFDEFIEGIDEEKQANAKKRKEFKEAKLLGNPNGLVNPPLFDELKHFSEKISKYENIIHEISLLPSASRIGWVHVNAAPIKQKLCEVCMKWKKSFTGFLLRQLTSNIDELYSFMARVETGIVNEVTEDSDNLKEVMGHIRDVKFKKNTIEGLFSPMKATTELLKEHNVSVEEDLLLQIEDSSSKWAELHEKTQLKSEELGPLQDKEASKIKEKKLEFNKDVREFTASFTRGAPFEWATGTEKAYNLMDEWIIKIIKIEKDNANLKNLHELFDLAINEYKDLRNCRKQITFLKLLWDTASYVLSQFSDWMKTPFKNVDVDYFIDETRKLIQRLKQFPTTMKIWACYQGLFAKVNNMLTALPLVQDLRDPAMRDRHWELLLEQTNKKGSIDPEDEGFTMEQLLDLGLHNYVEQVGEIVDQSKKELRIEKDINKIKAIWKDQIFEFEENEQLDIWLLGAVDEVIEILEEGQVQLNTMSTSRFVKFFIEEVTVWRSNLGTIDNVIKLWIKVQRNWSNLYPIFILSADIREQLPEDTQRFEKSDKVFRELMKYGKDVPNIVESCTKSTIREKMGFAESEDLYSILSAIQEDFEKCQKSLEDYLKTKRTAFPRFYFVSSTDLIDILSKGSYPQQVMKHMNKLIDATETLTFEPDDEEGNKSKVATGMISKEGEEVKWVDTYACTGAVETWLNGVLDQIKDTLLAIISESHSAFLDLQRDQWLEKYPAQVVIVISRIWWTTDVSMAFEKIEESGEETAMKDYNQQQIKSLFTLTELIQTDLDKLTRKKIITLITVDVHNRDVVAKLIENKVDNSNAFAWQSQLRYTLKDNGNCVINIADAAFDYNYEYIGNCGCLVITPLTDRCYITLTQSLRLVMGGAPAGPAGTGKTETTKDLSRALGTPVYVFNCTEQMDFLSLGNIFKGLAMTGAWGCFDEFNRIPVNVLSVVATQFKSILDAIKQRKTRFVFQDEEISLRKSCGVFITMNPGYAGRTELPENLKALFRPCAMVVPDLANICEIMLNAEGFNNAKPLSQKFVTLYALNRELLSKQLHYDWGLRAIKSVLVIAGGLKRAEPDISEDKILMRALRDTNMAKLSRDDIEIFLGLISDLFPNMSLPAKRDPKLDEHLIKASEARGLQQGGENEGMFILKCVQLKELLEVRHSVFVLGPGGSAKSSIIATLADGMATYGGKKVMQKILDPKAVTSFELYGYIHPQTREWRDGLLACIMRDLSNLSKTNDSPKWIILDGDIDTEWIESMNTVMDDNKVLTLASNERIPLASSMRLLFEIADLINASPATVSRAGILFVNETDIGWVPYKESWLEARVDDKEMQQLERLFDKYLPPLFTYIRKSGMVEHIIPIMNINMVTTLCNLLNSIITKKNCPNGSPNETYEFYFVFCCVWAFGGAFASDGTADYRVRFSKWWKKTFNQPPVRFPDNGTVYDYFVHMEADEDSESGFIHRFEKWDSLVEEFEFNVDDPFANIVVSTADTTRLSYVIDLLADADKPKPVMLVGTAGTGKTTIINKKLKKLPVEDVLFNNINFNSNTDSKTLQLILEQPLEKKAGSQYGPPGRKKLIYFVDDLNMPSPDLYGTQSAVSLMRQHIDYNFWYDRSKMEIRQVTNTQYMACMNPKAGSFIIDERLQRHFGTFSVVFPEKQDLVTIYAQIVAGQYTGYQKQIVAAVPKLVQATIMLHQKVTKQFLPTAIKFHYQFNLRELSSIFQGIGLANPKTYKTIGSVVKLWFHECQRVFADRFLPEDLEKFDVLLKQVATENFENVKIEELVTEGPMVFTSFMYPGESEDSSYQCAKTFEEMKECLDGKLEEYNNNSTYAAMSLELFKQAIEHVCRITRIIENPRGNALLIGVGGSGKQSLSRLSSFICGYETFQITVTSKYGIADFALDLIELYKKTGLKNEGYAFLITDVQIVDQKMLVYLNDLLSSGYIPDLFPQEEVDNIVGSIQSQVKAAGLDADNVDTCWDFFLENVRANLHVILCFSPVGEQFRIWCRKFPAIINCTSIDWFHDWPQDALVSVALKFLEEIDLGGEEMDEKVAKHMAFVHFAVNKASKDYKVIERRYNYTTPKSFLELIHLYMSLLKTKRVELEKFIDRYETGLAKLRESAEKVENLTDMLKEEQVIMKEKEQATNELVKKVTADKAKVGEQVAIADVEKEKTNAIAAEAKAFSDACKKDLEKAEPIVAAAVAALDTLQKNDITELRGFGKPAPAIVQVTDAIIILNAPETKKGPPKNKDLGWSQAKSMMKNVNGFLTQLKTFDKEHIPQCNVDAVEKYIKDPGFTQEKILKQSVAAAGLCGWVINIVAFHKINLEVEPKRIKQKEAEAKLAAANTALAKVNAEVASLKAQLQGLLNQLAKAEADKAEIVERARKTKLKLSLASRLVNGLADENVRWANEIDKLKVKEGTLVGDVLLAAAFLSYVGAFTKGFRDDLVFNKWIPDLKANEIPTTEGIEPVYGVLTNEATVAKWNNEGLPSDTVSVENGAIVIGSTRRWPLIIDPQLQGVKWIKNKEKGDKLHVIQLSQRKFLDVVERAIRNGEVVLIENLGESIDAILEPVLAKSLIKKGRNYYIKLGDKDDVEYDMRFKLYLQTKLSNPHYRPEIAAQTTLINFMVTESGLEDQLLATVVNKEDPSLEMQRVALLRKMNQFKIDIENCEDSLLNELKNAKGEILENTALIENLESTKLKAKEIAEAVDKANETSIIIKKKRELFRKVAERGSLMYFQIDQLSIIDHMYQYSLESYMVVFLKALKKATPAKDIGQRVLILIEAITETLFGFVSRGLFERHKLIFASIICFAIKKRDGTIDKSHLDFLLRGPKTLGDERPEEVQSFCSQSSWDSLQALTDIQGTEPSFEKLPGEMRSAWRRFKQWCEVEQPEVEKLPQEWKNLKPFQKLLIVRCLRPDRITIAVANFVEEQLGAKYIADSAVPLSVSFVDSGVNAPIFFILSPGVDPVKNVEALGKVLGFTEETGTFVNISLGQGQEIKAETALHKCFLKGGWVMLNNVHLTPKWLISLEKKLDIYSEMWEKNKKEEEKNAALAAKEQSAENGENENAEGGEQSTEETANAEEAATEEKAAEGDKDEASTEEKATTEEETTEETATEEKAEAEEEKTEVEETADENKTTAEEEAKEDVEGNDDEAEEDEEEAEGGDNEDESDSDSDSGYGSTDDDDLDDMSDFEDEDDGKRKKKKKKKKEHKVKVKHIDERDEVPTGHDDFRVFLTAEPSKAIPLGILQRSLKLTNEPPKGLKANIKRAFGQFTEDVWDGSSKQAEFKAILFALVYFHSVIVERKKFGAQGWNRNYPFNLGDLTTSIMVLSNYLEDRAKIPWDDLRYVFGEIMYGGHITDDLDRLLCMTYLRKYIRKEVVESIELCPGFMSPPTLNYNQYLEYVDTELPSETPTVYGLHPNAEIGFRTAQGEALFLSILKLQPKVTEGGGLTIEEQVAKKIAAMLDDSNPSFNLIEIADKIADDRSPYQNVFYQECERMNILLFEVNKSLRELTLGLKGELTMSDRMQSIQDAVYANLVPSSWFQVAYPSLRKLDDWLIDLKKRNEQLREWVDDLSLPKVTWISGFFNPQAFLTAIQQTTARKMTWALDKMTLHCDVTKKLVENIEEFDSVTRDGAFIYGMYLEGARWDMATQALEHSKLKELHPSMPVCLIKAIPVDAQSSAQYYYCPVYKTKSRGPTWVFNCNLKTKLPASTWIIGGVAIILDV